MRPLKIYQKISGTILSMDNAQENLDNRSFVAITKRQWQNVLHAMRRLFKEPINFEINLVA